MQIKNHTKILLEWLPSKTQTTNHGEAVGKKESLYIADGHVS
jgi:hypothetical protein